MLYGRVILSHSSRALVCSVFYTAEVFVLLSLELGVIDTRLCFPQCYAINTIRSTSSSSRPQDLPSGEGCINSTLLLFR